MKTLFLNIFLIATFTFTVTAEAGSTRQCKNLFATDPFTKQVLPKEMSLKVGESVKNIKNSTTGSRLEDKWTLLRSKVESLISELSTGLTRYNLAVKARDKVTPGTKNVTQTVYLNKFELNLADTGLEVSQDYPSPFVTLKPRIRKYGTIRVDQSVELENVQLTPFTKHHSFVEFKFPNAKFLRGGVFKPRMYMADKYIKLFGTKEFLKRYEEIVQDTLNYEINKADTESVEAMLEFFRIGHMHELTFEPLAVNLYERISYAVDFVDQNKNNSTFQVQMTLDKSIKFYVYQLQKTIAAYKAEDSVIEIKTPNEYAQLDLNSDLSGIEGYARFLKFVSDVKKNHNPEYQEGVGKMGHGHKEYLNEN